MWVLSGERRIGGGGMVMSNAWNPVAVYARMGETLESLVGGDGLGVVFRRVRETDADGQMPIVCTEDIARMLRRIGILSDQCTPEAAQKRFEELIREIAQAVTRTPIQVVTSFRMYASGLYGVMPHPVCGAVPQCKQCALTKQCDHFNLPRRQKQRLSPAQILPRDGVEMLSDEDVVALLIGGERTGEPQRALARELLDHFGALRNLGAASYAELHALRNVTHAMALRLTAAAALSRRMVNERRHQGPGMRTSKDFYDLYHLQLRDYKKEVFLVVLLDQKNRVIREEVVSSGTLTQALVHPREVFRPAIQAAAAKIAFLHNHPSGDSTPSPEDIKLTKRLVETGVILGIEVLDHVIVGEGAYTSFIDEGYM